MKDFEKLGAFYLGKRYDLGDRELEDDLILYDSKDLTTHAICVGMTGSGKTGLCLTLLEEAAIDGVPAIIIDPKGDLPNLALAFEKLDPESFRPWIDEGEATREGATVEQYAATVAARWRKGLAEWGQGPARIKNYCASVDIPIYTPGSNSGLPLTVLRSFNAPKPELIADNDAYRAHVTAAASGLLALLGIDADPVQDREHILIATLLDHAWRAGKNVDVAELIRQIQDPPLATIGVVPLDSFYPDKDRNQLAMRLNNLLASPSFAGWMEGEPLDVSRLLYTREGKPRLAIISIAHLSDPERMFFVTILLNEVIGWMRSQPGTSSLRALLYMDEVFGFFPPISNPPSKTPMLTLLKQARAHGLGVVLATQNPVDLDYKGLSNIGTWFLGRLQTARDKQRVLEGLEGAAAQTGSQFDRAKMDQALAALGKRVFLMNNVHEDGPVTFHTRWAMSYLRGPLTRAQIKKLMDPRRPQGEAEPTATNPGASETAKMDKGSVAGRKTAGGPGATTAPEVEVADSAASTARPKLPRRVRERFLAPLVPSDEDVTLAYRPALLAKVHLHYARASYKIDLWEDFSLLVRLPERVKKSPWTDETLQVEPTDLALDKEPEAEATYLADAELLGKWANYTRWKKQCETFCYQTRPMQLYRCAELKSYSQPGESEGEFRARLRHLARERRDVEVEKLRNKYARRVARSEENISKAEARVAREEAQRGRAYTKTAWSFGSTIMEVLFGRKTRSRATARSGSRAARDASEAYKQHGDVRAAKAKLSAEKKSYRELKKRIERETKRIDAAYEPDALAVEPLVLRPRKSDIEIERIALVWLPFHVHAEGQMESVHEIVPVEGGEAGAFSKVTASAEVLA